MPASFLPVPPGAAGNALINLRGPHAVLLTGDTLWVLDLVPELRAMSVAAAPPLDGSVVPYPAWSWLGLPVLKPDFDDLPLQPWLWSFVVDAQRLGFGIDACKPYVSLSPCSMSVARARFKTALPVAFHVDPSPFTVGVADWYATERPLPGTPAGFPQAALSLRIQDVIDNDGTLEPLGVLEPLVAPRLRVADRGLALNFGRAFLVLADNSFTGLPAAVAGAATVEETSNEYGRILKAAVPDSMYLKHSTSKSDPFGFFFGTTPSFLAFSASAPRNACRRLAEFEISAGGGAGAEATELNGAGRDAADPAATTTDGLVNHARREETGGLQDAAAFYKGEGAAGASSAVDATAEDDSAAGAVAAEADHAAAATDGLHEIGR